MARIYFPPYGPSTKYIAKKKPGFDFGKIMGNPEEVKNPQGIFRFMDLPAELRICVYSYLLPYKLAFSFRGNRLFADSPGHPPRPCYSTVWGYVLNDFPESLRLHGIQTQLLLVNKEVYKETQAILFGSNTYNFVVTCHSDWRVYLRLPQIFGPFGTSHHLPLLRKLRSIAVAVSLNEFTHEGVKRLHARLRYFVSVLKKHAGKQSLLQNLIVHVEMVTDPRDPPYSAHEGLVTVETLMFGLESLTKLRGIRNVKVTGVPDWYARCLTLSLQGTGGDVRKYAWPLSARKKWNIMGRARHVSAMEWWQPTLDWKEFAERNGVEMPEDVGKFWAVEE